MKANGDPHSITSDDIHFCRSLGVTDPEFAEIIEIVNTCNAFNTFAGALNIGADDFLTYAEYHGKRSGTNS